MTRARIITGLLIVLAIVAAFYATSRAGRRAGRADVTAAAEHDRGERIVEARSDERQAAVVSESISRRVSRADALSTAAVAATIKDLRNAIDTVPPAAAGDPLPAAPVERMRDTLNADIARANRAADAADALP